MRAGIKGLIITAAFIGPGTVTTATMVGAHTGYGLVLLLVFAILATFSLQEMASRLGTVTKLGLSQAIMQSLPSLVFKLLVAALVIVAIGVGNAAYEGGNLTGAALGLSSSFGGSIQTWALVLGLTALVMIVSGHYKVVEGFLVALVVVMSVVFITLMLYLGINTSLLSQSANFTQVALSNSTLALALIGTTVVPYNLFLHAGLSAQDASEQATPSSQSLGKQNGQLFASLTLGGLVTFAILSGAVSAFFVNQLGVDKGNIAQQLTPLFGENASLFFGLGLFAAGLSSAITAPLAAAFAISGLFGWQCNLRDWRFKATALAILALGTLVAAMGFKPLQLIVIAQTSNAMLLPVSAILLVWVCNRTALLGEHKNGWLSNAGAGLVLLLVIGLATHKLFS